MKTAFAIGILAVCCAPQPCHALWGIAQVTKESAKDLGMEVRGTKEAGDVVGIELEFAIAGMLKDFDRVDLRLMDGNESLLIVPLKEDRSVAEHVTVSFVADRSQIDKLRLWVMVPESLGGTVYEVRVAEFVE